jgi:hypothetical protein
VCDFNDNRKMFSIILFYIIIQSVCMLLYNFMDNLINQATVEVEDLHVIESSRRGSRPRDIDHRFTTISTRRFWQRFYV